MNTEATLQKHENANNDNPASSKRLEISTQIIPQQEQQFDDALNPNLDFLGECSIDSTRELLFKSFTCSSNEIEV